MRASVEAAVTRVASLSPPAAPMPQAAVAVLPCSRAGASGPPVPSEPSSLHRKSHHHRHHHSHSSARSQREPFQPEHATPLAATGTGPSEGDQRRSRPQTTPHEGAPQANGSKPPASARLPPQERTGASTEAMRAPKSPGPVSVAHPLYCVPGSHCGMHFGRERASQPPLQSQPLQPAPPRHAPPALPPRAQQAVPSRPTERSAPPSEAAIETRRQWARRTEQKRYERATGGGGIER